jgi:hypothetical protein
MKNRPKLTPIAVDEKWGWLLHDPSFKFNRKIAERQAEEKRRHDG